MYDTCKISRKNLNHNTNSIDFCEAPPRMQFHYLNGQDKHWDRLSKAICARFQQRLMFNNWQKSSGQQELLENAIKQPVSTDLRRNMKNVMIMVGHTSVWVCEVAFWGYFRKSGVVFYLIDFFSPEILITLRWQFFAIVCKISETFWY